jgi:hypothetical protein
MRRHSAGFYLRHLLQGPLRRPDLRLRPVPLGEYRNIARPLRVAAQRRCIRRPLQPPRVRVAGVHALIQRNAKPAWVAEVILVRVHRPPLENPASLQLLHQHLVRVENVGHIATS